jgi:hypothetical protein
MTEEPKPKNKGGRPKGSRNRPKWLLEAIKKAPKRPRGRPKGSKNKPKTLHDFLAASLAISELGPPPKRKRLKLSAKVRKKRAENLGTLSKRREYGRTHNGLATVPKGWRLKDYAPHAIKAQNEAKRMIAIMEKQGLLDEMDEMGKTALKTAFSLMQEPGSKEFKLKALRTVLEYTKAKPAAKSDVTIRTAEDFLDELAAKEHDG